MPPPQHTVLTVTMRGYGSNGEPDGVNVGSGVPLDVGVPTGVPLDVGVAAGVTVGVPDDEAVMDGEAVLDGDEVSVDEAARGERRRRRRRRWWRRRWGGSAHQCVPDFPVFACPPTLSHHDRDLPVSDGDGDADGDAPALMDAEAEDVADCARTTMSRSAIAATRCGGDAAAARLRKGVRRVGARRAVVGDTRAV